MKLLKLENIKRLLNLYLAHDHFYKLLGAYVKENKPLTLYDNYFLLKQCFIAKRKNEDELQHLCREFLEDFSYEETSLLDALIDKISFEQFQHLSKLKVSDIIALSTILSTIKYSGFLNDINIADLLDLQTFNLVHHQIEVLSRAGVLNRETAAMVFANPYRDISQAIIEHQEAKLGCDQLITYHLSPLRIVRGLTNLKNNNLLTYIDLLKKHSAPDLMADAIVVLHQFKINPRHYIDVLDLAVDPLSIAKTLVDLNNIGMLNDDKSVRALIEKLENNKGQYNYNYSVNAELKKGGNLNKNLYLLTHKHPNPYRFAKALTLLSSRQLVATYLEEVSKSKEPVLLAEVIVFLETRKLVHQVSIAELPSSPEQLEKLWNAVLNLTSSNVACTADDFMNLLKAEKPLEVAMQMQRLPDQKSRELLRYTEDPTKLTETILSLNEFQCFDQVYQSLREELVKQSEQRAEKQKQTIEKNQRLFLFSSAQLEGKPKLIRRSSAPSL